MAIRRDGPRFGPPLQSEIRVKTIQRPELATMADVLEVAGPFFNGGTDFRRPLTETRQIIEAGRRPSTGSGHRFERADIVFVTDESCRVTPEFLAEFDASKKQTGTRVFAVLVDVGCSAEVPVQQRADQVYRVRLPHPHWLEAALQGRILRDVLAVLVGRGGPDDPQVTPRQRGLEDVARVERPALDRPCPQDGVDLVNEQDDVTGSLDLVHQPQQPLLELTPVGGTGDESGSGQFDQPGVLQFIGDAADSDDRLTFGQRRQPARQMSITKLRQFSCREEDDAS